MAAGSAYIDLAVNRMLHNCTMQIIILYLMV